MKVNNIKEYVESFKNYLKKGDLDSILYKYENLKVFRGTWDIEDLDLKSTFDKSFDSKISNQLWGGSVNSAKSMMLMFLDHNKEFCRSMFKDLFNSEKDLAMRINRFSFHCDQLLDEIMKTTEKINDHFHTPKVISLYLCFNDPAQYCIIDYPAFSAMLKLLETKNIPESYELDRCLKLCKGLLTILSKDEELVELYQSILPEKYQTEFNMLMAYDYYLYSSKKNNP